MTGDVVTTPAAAPGVPPVLRSGPDLDGWMAAARAAGHPVEAVRTGWWRQPCEDLLWRPGPGPDGTIAPLDLQDMAVERARNQAAWVHVILPSRAALWRLTETLQSARPLTPADVDQVDEDGSGSPGPRGRWSTRLGRALWQWLTGQDLRDGRPMVGPAATFDALVAQASRRLAPIAVVAQWDGWTACVLQIPATARWLDPGLLDPARVDPARAARLARGGVW